MPHERTAALDRLTEALWRAWAKAGPPSYNDFAKRSEEILGRARRLSSSTTQEILTGQRRRPARWDWIRRYWTVLRAVAAEHDIDPDSLGTLDALKKLHEAACAAQSRTPQLAGISGTRADGHPSPGAILGDAIEPGKTSQQRTALVSAGADAQGDEVLTAIRQAIGVEWWHNHHDVVPSCAETYLSLEPAAKLIRTYETAVVPGLLQTAAYAGAMLRLDPYMLPEAAITRMVQLRMRRQQILTQPNPLRLWAVFDERVLGRQFGDVMIMRTQIQRLMELSELPNITIQLIPSVTRIRAALSYPITLLRFHIHELPDVVYLEQLTSASYLHTPDHVSRYMQVLSGLSMEALQPADTANYLRRILRYT
jgi:hypothetical protein